MKLFVFGLGYSAQAVLQRLAPRLSSVAGTVRTRAKADRVAAGGVTVRLLNNDSADPAIATDLAGADALLVSAPPGDDGDPILPRFARTIAASPRLAWIGYLSTIGVYGDRGGGLVSEDDEPRPGNARGHARIAAEAAWLQLGAEARKPVAVLRLGGIYGPGRNALVNLADGSARRIIKPGQVFNRIHVEDIAGAVEAALDHAGASAGRGGVFNVTDDEPAPPQDVIAYAARLLGLDLPPAIDFASAELSPMARSFYGQNKRVSNTRAKQELGWRLRYPTYREGLQALFDAGEGSAIGRGR
jgi:nucleoside-diphosphate-sugar epimerase